MTSIPFACLARRSTVRILEIEDILLETINRKAGLRLDQDSNLILKEESSVCSFRATDVMAIIQNERGSFAAHTMPDAHV